MSDITNKQLVFKYGEIEVYSGDKMLCCGEIEVFWCEIDGFRMGSHFADASAAIESARRSLDAAADAEIKCEGGDL